MENKPENIELAFSDIAQGGTSDKVYIVNLSEVGGGWTVVAQYGRRGNALATDVKTKNGPLEYDAAKKLYDKTVAGKIAKGYQPTGARAAAAQIAPPKTYRSAPPGLPAKEWRFGATDVRAQELLVEIDEATAEKLILSDDHWMQDKSDGHSRGVVKNAAGEIFGLNKLGKPVPLPAEIHAEISRIVAFDTFQIDAELVGNKLVMRDLIYADGPIHEMTYEERFKMLVKATAFVGMNDGEVEIVKTWEGARRKRIAFDLQRSERREGVVFKLRTAPHRAGRNGQHKKFKFVKTLSAIAGKPRANGKDSVEVFLVDGEKLARVGTVSLIGKPTVFEGDVLEVAYLYAFPSKKLSQARLLRKRDDVLATECTTCQLVFKRE